MTSFLKAMAGEIHVTGNFQGFVNHAIAQSIELAKQLEVVVILHFNGKKIIITRHTRQEDAEQDYMEAE